MQPIVVTYNLPAGNASTIAQSQASTSGALQLNGTLGTAVGGVLGTYQQRVTITSGGDDRGIGFKIVGLNQAGFTQTEIVTGTNATTAQSNIDFRKVISITPQNITTGGLATTASTVSAGTNGVGSSLWNIVNWNATPSNIAFSGAVVGTLGVNYSIQYTYDDPNNLPAGIQYPQPFNHPTLVTATSTVDGATNDPITAWRLLINSGTGTVRATGIQSGLASP